MFGPDFLILKLAVAHVSGNIDERIELVEKEREDKQSQVILLRTTVRQNLATKSDQRLLARLETELEEIQMFRDLLVAHRDLHGRSEFQRFSKRKKLVKFLFRPVLVFLMTNASLLYVLCYFAHVPAKVCLFVIPASLVFLGWIWYTERNRFLRSANRHWEEMSNDIGKLLSKRKDKAGN